MNRYVPHLTAFDIAKKLEFAQNIVLVVSTGLTIISIALNSFPKNGFNCERTIDIVNALSSLFAIGYIVLDVLINNKFYNAGIEKRLDLIDHAFDTNFSGEKSVGYFNAQGVNKGIYKLAALAFENSLFSSEIAKKMTLNKWAISLVITAIFILSATMGNKMLVNNIIQIAATGVLIQQTIRLQQFSNRIGKIHSDFKSLFNDLKDMQDKSSKEGEIIRNVLNYETTNSWSSILLDSTLFDKMNPKLSEKWERIKQNYKIS